MHHILYIIHSNYKLPLFIRCYLNIAFRFLEHKFKFNDFNKKKNRKKLTGFN